MKEEESKIEMVIDKSEKYLTDHKSPMDAGVLNDWRRLEGLMPWEVWAKITPFDRKIILSFVLFLVLCLAYILASFLWA